MDRAPYVEQNIPDPKADTKIPVSDPKPQKTFGLPDQKAEEDLAVFFSDIARPRMLPRCAGVLLYVLLFSFMLLFGTLLVLFGGGLTEPETYGWLILSGSSVAVQWLILEPLKVFIMVLYWTYVREQVLQV